MAAFFVDLDGTIFKWGTNELLPGALNFLKEITDNNDVLIFTTGRGERYNSDPKDPMCKINTLEALKQLDIKYDLILWDVPQTRIIINDAPVLAVKKGKNKEVSFKAKSLIELAKEDKS